MGAFTTSVVIPPKLKWEINIFAAGHFELPKLKYNQRVPISTLKYDNLQVLKKFCEDPNAQAYFDNLIHYKTANDDEICLRNKSKKYEKW